MCRAHRCNATMAQDTGPRNALPRRELAVQQPTAIAKVSTLLAAGHRDRQLGRPACHVLEPDVDADLQAAARRTDDPGCPGFWCVCCGIRPHLYSLSRRATSVSRLPDDGGIAIYEVRFRRPLKCSKCFAGYPTRSTSAKRTQMQAALGPQLRQPITITEQRR
jgi:hypothetical protein